MKPVHHEMILTLGLTICRTCKKPDGLCLMLPLQQTIADNSIKQHTLHTAAVCCLSELSNNSMWKTSVGKQKFNFQGIRTNHHYLILHSHPPSLLLFNFESCFFAALSSFLLAFTLLSSLTLYLHYLPVAVKWFPAFFISRVFTSLFVH